MYELWHLGLAYVAGTAAGLGIFREWIKTGLVTRALDNLVEQDYIRSYVDSEGVTQLYKWYELEGDLLEQINRAQKTRQLIEEAIEVQDKLWEETDDSA